MVGRLMAALCAGLIVLVFATGLGATSVAGCARPCSGGTQSQTQTLSRTGHPAPLPCVRDVACGGGATLGTGTGVGFGAALVVTAGAAALGLGVWRRRRRAGRSPLGRLLVSGLFRPPRLLLDI